jgi:DNA-binding NarL/FixJ family response regulator
MSPELSTQIEPEAPESAAGTALSAGRTNRAPRSGTVAVAHRYRLYLEGLLQLLKSATGIELVGHAETEEQLLQCVKRTRPEIVIFEPFATDGDDLEVLDAIRATSPGTKILIILQVFDGARLLKALRKGAWGYFSHSTTTDEFLKAIQATRRGELWIERAMMRRLLLESARYGEDSAAPPLPHLGDARFKLLRPREAEIANLVATGLSNKRIASKLNITESTVKTHLVHIFRKFDIHHRMELAAFLRDRGQSD